MNSRLPAEEKRKRRKKTVLGLTTNQVWEAVENEFFAVIGMVTAKKRGPHGRDHDRCTRSKTLFWQLQTEFEVEPNKGFITYGVGVTRLQMRDPNQARARVSVNGTAAPIRITQD